MRIFTTTPRTSINPTCAKHLHRSRMFASSGNHEIFGVFGNYPSHMQDSQMFRNIGRIWVEMYLLFQHHTTLKLLRNVGDDMDLFTIAGNGVAFCEIPWAGVGGCGPRCEEGEECGEGVGRTDVSGLVSEG